MNLLTNEEVTELKALAYSLPIRFLHWPYLVRNSMTNQRASELIIEAAESHERFGVENNTDNSKEAGILKEVAGLAEQGRLDEAWAKANTLPVSIREEIPNDAWDYLESYSDE